MAVITAQMVKEIREITSAGMLDCKKALTDADGNLDEAIKLLRERGLAKAAKKAGRIAAEGAVVSYIHGGRIGVLVEINSETDFVGKLDEFQSFARDVAMQIAATNPRFVSRLEVSQDHIEEEKSVLRNQALNEGKPAQIVDKMVEGRIEKFYKEVCLLEQTFIRNPDITIQDYLNEKISKIGENISIRRFARFEVGEGIEKEESNFAEEVAKQIGSN
jgi:elongation factor Ts